MPSGSSEASSRSSQFIDSMSPACASSAVAAGSAAGQMVKRRRVARSRVSMVRNMPRFYFAYFGLRVMGVPPGWESGGGVDGTVGGTGIMPPYDT